VVVGVGFCELASGRRGEVEVVGVGVGVGALLLRRSPPRRLVYLPPPPPCCYHYSWASTLPTAATQGEQTFIVIHQRTMSPNHNFDFSFLIKIIIGKLYIYVYSRESNFQDGSLYTIFTFSNSMTLKLFTIYIPSVRLEPCPKGLLM
jgi:hypothetical protein